MASANGPATLPPRCQTISKVFPDHAPKLDPGDSLSLGEHAQTPPMGATGRWGTGFSREI